MYAPVKSCVNTGVALVGASVIAVGPLVALEEPAHISKQAVQLAADPISFYTQVFQTAAANGGQLLQEAVSNSVTAATQALNLVGADAAWIASSLWNAAASIAVALTTVPGYIPEILVDLASGDLEGAINDLSGAVSAALLPVSAVASLANVIVEPVVNAITALAQFDPILVAYSLAGPVINLFGATGASIQGVIDAVAAGDVQRLVDAVLTAPAVVIDGLLNGGYGPAIVIPSQPPSVPFETRILSSGLLSVGGAIEIGLVQAPGPIAMLMTIGKVITDELLKPPSPTSPIAPENAAIASAADTFTVSLPQETTETLAPKSEPTETSPVADAIQQIAVTTNDSQLAADGDDAADDVARHTRNDSFTTDALEGDGRITTSEQVGQQNVVRPSIRAVPTTGPPSTDTGTGTDTDTDTQADTTDNGDADDAAASNAEESN